MGPPPPVLSHPLGGDPRVEGVHQRQSRTQQVPFDLHNVINVTSNFHKQKDTLGSMSKQEFP